MRVKRNLPVNFIRHNGKVAFVTDMDDLTQVILRVDGTSWIGRIVDNDSSNLASKPMDELRNVLQIHMPIVVGSKDSSFSTASLIKP